MDGNNRRLVLQPRDRHLLEELATMRVVDREQAKIVAGFGSTTRANTRLLALTRAGLLRRCFLGTRAGGTKALYMLSSKGAQAVGVPLSGPRRRQDEAVIADFYIEHQLRINELYCLLKYHPIPVPGVTFRKFKSFHEPLTPAIRLIPDGYVEFTSASGIVSAFLEVDLGTETLAVWKAKAQNYLQFAVSGECERQFGQSRFRVAVVAHSERRMRSIRAAVGAATEKIFWLGSFESINQHGFFGAAWLRPRNDAPQSFLTGPLTP